MEQTIDAQIQRNMAMMELYQAHCEVASSRKFILAWENDDVAQEMQALLDEFEIYWHKLADACYMAEVVGGNMSVWRLLKTIDPIFMVEITCLPIYMSSHEILVNIHNDCPSLYGNSAKSELEYIIKQYREQGVVLPNLKKR